MINFKETQLEINETTFYIKELDKTFIDVQIYINAQPMKLKTIGYYGELSPKETKDLTKDLILKMLKKTI
jgi:hypothetical protein